MLSLFHFILIKVGLMKMVLFILESSSYFYYSKIYFFFFKQYYLTKQTQTLKCYYIELSFPCEYYDPGFNVNLFCVTQLCLYYTIWQHWLLPLRAEDFLPISFAHNSYLHVLWLWSGFLSSSTSFMGQCFSWSTYNDNRYTHPISCIVPRVKLYGFPVFFG